jgi:TPR repeat protein
MKNLLKQAEKGDVKAQVTVAARLATGEKCKQDLKNAYFWYKKAASLGNPDAIYNLALMTLLGEGIKKDQNKALKLLFKAVDAGSADACMLLGESYEFSNLNLEINYMEAANFYLKAMKLGMSNGIRNLASMLEEDKISLIDFIEVSKKF